MLKLFTCKNFPIQYALCCETDICILKHGLDWSNLSHNLVMYQYGFYQCSSNHNQTFKGTETCGHAMIRKGGPLKTNIFGQIPPKQ